MSSRIIFLHDLKELPEDYDRTSDQYYLLIDPDEPHFAKQVNLAVTYGFGDPIMLTHDKYMSYQFTSSNQVYTYDNPFEHGREKQLCMHLLRKDKPNIHDVIKQIEFCLYHHTNSDDEKEICTTHMKIEPKTLKILRHHTRNKPKEISGKFVMQPVSPHLVSVKLDESSMKVGGKENASYHESVGSFHTHPYSAYKRHSVCVAFPSSDDYATTIFLYSTEMGAFHILSSIEGIYLITIKPSFARKHSPKEVFTNLKKWEKYVMDRYDIGYPECPLDRDNHAFWSRYIAKYLKKINKKRVFYVQFKPWESAHKPFKWQYRSSGSSGKNCAVSDRQIHHLQKINNPSNGK